MRFLRFLWGWWGGPPPPPAPAERTVMVMAEVRQARVAAENRIWAVEAETRTVLA
jgi:hypothetical protein